MWLSIISFLGGPVVKGLVDSYREKLKSNNADNRMATDLAATDIAAQTAEIKAITELKIAQIGHPWEPEKLAFYVVLLYMAKVMLWDAAFGFGTTDAVRGDVSMWAALVVSYYFGKRTIVSVTDLIGRIFKR